MSGPEDQSGDQSGSEKCRAGAENRPNTCSSFERKAPARADVNGRSLKFPTVEVAGSNPVPRSNNPGLPISELRSRARFLRPDLRGYLSREGNFC
jgi:hypothetical protein